MYYLNYIRKYEEYFLYSNKILKTRSDVEQEVVHEAHTLSVDGSNPSITLFFDFFFKAMKTFEIDQ